MNTFTLTGSDIYLYGAAAIGSIIFDDCIKMGLSPIAFIDRRGDEIEEFKGLPVLSKSVIDGGIISKEAVIIISVKNVFEHSEIAAWLLNNGYKNLVFRPLAALKGFGMATENELNRLYDRLMEADVSLPEIFISKTDEINHVQYVEGSFIRDAGERVIAYVPLELVYTDLPKRGIVSRWNDIPILSLIGHIEFFRWLSGEGNTDYKRYIEFCEESAERGGVIKITDAWRENVLRNRADVYENMNNSLQRDFEFFISNAAYASYNKKGYFNLESGKHRAAFFASKRLRYLPLNLKKNDYEKWITESEYAKRIDDCKRLHLMNTNAPIEFPYFYEVPCKSGAPYFELLCLLMHEVAVNSLDKYKEMRFDAFYASICLDDDGYISRCLSRYGIVCENHNSSEISKVFANENNTAIEHLENGFFLVAADLKIKEKTIVEGDEEPDLMLLFEKDTETETEVDNLYEIKRREMMIGGSLRKVRLLASRNATGR